VWLNDLQDPLFILALAELEYTVVTLLFWRISFQLSQISYDVLKDSIWKQKRGDEGSDTLLSVDGTDFRTRWINSLIYSYKFKKAGFRYKIWIGIRRGDICMINGPYSPGVWNDDMIFGDALVGELE